VVGDLAYNTKTGKKAFIGRELLPLLMVNYPTVSALDIIPTGLAARAAATQATILGGDVEAAAERIVVSQDEFFPLFIDDLHHAQRRVVIFSPFLTANRVAQLEVPLRAAVDRDVPVYAVTRSGVDRNKTETPEYRRLERQLTEWGLILIHKRRMHEKLVFIDDQILWCGSLNPLSFSNTQEVMERRNNPHVFDDFAKTMRLDDLIGGFGAGSPTCPICDAPMETAEAKSEPFYWVCPTTGCYSRSIGAPELADGRLVCATCTGAVEYGEWGGEPHWRCVSNKKHRLRVVGTHLKLPKMRAIIPKGELRRLDRIYGTGGG
jgi:hypothetical protein